MCLVFVCLCRVRVHEQEGIAALFEEHGPVVKIKFLPIKVRPRLIDRVRCLDGAAARRRSALRLRVAA